LFPRRSLFSRNGSIGRSRIPGPTAPCYPFRVETLKLSLLKFPRFFCPRLHGINEIGPPCSARRDRWKSFFFPNPEYSVPRSPVHTTTRAAAFGRRSSTYARPSPRPCVPVTHRRTFSLPTKVRFPVISLILFPGNIESSGANRTIPTCPGRYGCGPLAKPRFSPSPRKSRMRPLSGSFPLMSCLPVNGFRMTAIHDDAAVAAGGPFRPKSLQLKETADWGNVGGGAAGPLWLIRTWTRLSPHPAQH